MNNSCDLSHVFESHPCFTRTLLCDSRGTTKYDAIDMCTFCRVARTRDSCGRNGAQMERLRLTLFILMYTDRKQCTSAASQWWTVFDTCPGFDLLLLIGLDLDIGCWLFSKDSMFWATLSGKGGWLRHGTRGRHPIHSQALGHPNCTIRDPMMPLYLCTKRPWQSPLHHGTNLNCITDVYSSTRGYYAY